MTSESSVESNDKIYLHTAKLVTNKNGFIYNKNVINSVKIGHVVRISFEIVFEEISYWNHDAPYVKITMQHNDGSFLGEVQNINRIANTNSYPVAIGDRIWFKLENIIEIPGEYNNDVFEKFVTSYNVPVTGPLYTIEDNNESESESDSESSAGSESDPACNESCSDSD